MRRLSGVVFLAAALSACAEQRLPLADMTRIEAADGSVATIDIYAARRAAGEAVPPQRSSQIVEIRTFLPRINDFGQEVEGQEVAGAECEASLEGLTARVRTPGGLQVPLYGYVTAPMAVTCWMDGFDDAIAVFRPFNKTVSDRRASASAAGSAGGLLGAVVAAVVIEGINAASDETTDELQYASTPVLLRRSELAIASAAQSPAVAASGAATTKNASSMAAAPAPAVQARAKPGPVMTPRAAGTAAGPRIAARTGLRSLFAGTASVSQLGSEPRARFEWDSTCSPWCGTSRPQPTPPDPTASRRSPTLAVAEPKSRFERDATCSPWCSNLGPQPTHTDPKKPPRPVAAPTPQPQEGFGKGQIDSGLCAVGIGVEAKGQFA